MCRFFFTTQNVGSSYVTERYYVLLAQRGHGFFRTSETDSSHDVTAMPRVLPLPRRAHLVPGIGESFSGHQPLATATPVPRRARQHRHKAQSARPSPPPTKLATLPPLRHERAAVVQPAQRARRPYPDGDGHEHSPDGNRRSPQHHQGSQAGLPLELRRRLRVASFGCRGLLPVARSRRPSCRRRGREDIIDREKAALDHGVAQGEHLFPELGVGYPELNRARGKGTGGGGVRVKRGSERGGGEETLICYMYFCLAPVSTVK